MHIHIENLCKSYGEQIAVDELSFELDRGELVGFLGPNGAGKSTTMKLMTGYLAANSGSVLMDGQLMKPENHRLRREIGYLPEHNPLYTDLYVQEYLHLTAGMYGLHRKWAAVRQVIEETGLGKEQHKRIGALSKGYRQRVGIAQALIHRPQLLILDEPTTGLDPNQLEDIRSLIRQIAQEKTVFLSTHIMQEVEAICNRVLIIHEGRIIADNSAEQLREGGLWQGAQQVQVEFSSPIDWRLLQAKLEASTVQCLSPTQFLVCSSTASDIRPQLFHLAVEQAWVIIELSEKQASLEQVFQQLTKPEEHKS